MTSQNHGMAHECGLTVNNEKLAVRQPSLTFFRCVYDKDGTHHNSAKVNTVHTLPALVSPSQLQEFLDMTT